jgi:1-phosphofructokinase family hexose kinase
MESKLLIVNLNLAVAKTAAVPSLRKGKIYRLSDVETLAGGKGVNVARVLSSFGVKPLVAGLVAGHNGRWITEALSCEGFESVCVPYSPGESRVCYTIADSSDGVATDFNEEGSPVPRSAQKKFLTLFPGLLKGCGFAAFSGRICSGMAADYFAKLITVARRHRVLTALDTSGAPLREAVKAGPSLFKMNREEFFEASGEKLSPRAVVRFFRKVLRYGTEYVIVTDGPRPAWAVTPQNLWKFTPPKIKVVSAVGAGDSFMAGLLYGFASGRSRQECVRLAIGAASSDCMSLGAGAVDKRQCFEFARKAAIKRLALGD